MTHDEMYLRKKIGEQVFWYQRRNLTSVRLLRQSRYLESGSASFAKRNSARKHDNYALDCLLGKSSEGNIRGKESERREGGEGERIRKVEYSRTRRKSAAKVATDSIPGFPIPESPRVLQARLYWFPALKGNAR